MELTAHPLRIMYACYIRYELFAGLQAINNVHPIVAPGNILLTTFNAFIKPVVL